MRQIIGIFDEYTSKENGKNVTRAMRESAKQGFWNGSTPPLGYRVVEAERRGAKIKKRLEVDPVEAETVRLIYKLYTDGDGTSGPLGVKQTTSWLNRHGYRTRRGAHFGVGPLHRILKNACYATGKWRYGIRNSRTGTLHDPASIVEIEVPTILSAGPVRTGPAPALPEQSARNTAAHRQRADTAGRPGRLCLLRRRDDPYRHPPAWAALQLLQLRRQPSEGQGGLSGTAYADGKARRADRRQREGASVRRRPPGPHPRRAGRASGGQGSGPPGSSCLSGGRDRQPRRSSQAAVSGDRGGHRRPRRRPQGNGSRR